MAQRHERFTPPYGQARPIFRTDDDFDDLDAIEIARPYSPALPSTDAEDDEHDPPTLDELELPRSTPVAKLRTTVTTSPPRPATKPASRATVRPGAMPAVKAARTRVEHSPFDTARAATSTYRAPREPFLRTYSVPLFIAVASVALIAVAQGAWARTLEAVGTTAAELALREGDGQTQLTVTVGLAALALLAFAVAWGRATHPRRAVRLSGDRGRMGVDAIAGGLRDVLLELRDVREASVQVENKGGGKVSVRAWLRVGTDARIDDTLDQVDDTAEWLIHQQLGLLMPEPALVDLKYDELDLRASRRRQAERAANPQASSTTHEGEQYE